jgi:hypothetical protein
MRADLSKICNGRGRRFEPVIPAAHSKILTGMYGPKLTGKSGSNKGPLCSIASFLRVHLTRVLTHARNHHPYNLALCSALMSYIRP